MFSKKKNTLFMPYVHKENCYFAYSQKGDERIWNIKTNKKSAKIYNVSSAGLSLINTYNIKNGMIHLKINPNQALLIELL